MHWLLGLVVKIALVAGSTFSVAGTGMAEKLVIPSVTHTDLRFISFSVGTGVPVNVAADLTFPQEKKERYPVVLIGHTIAGWNEGHEGWFAGELRKAGFATLGYDSFKPRQFGTVTGGGPHINPAVIADAFAALKILAAHPKVDPNRIAIVGYSLGGDTAHVAAFEQVRAVLAPSNRFAAHVAFYPAWTFGASAGPRAYTGAPVLLLFGEKDQLTPPKKVKPYLEFLEKGQSKAPIEAITYPGAHHAWSDQSVSQVKFLPTHGSTRNCPMTVIGGGALRLLVDGAEIPFDRALFDKCRGASAGYTVGFSAQVRAKSLADTIGFLRKHLAP
jgi:dienelactone hydrolase